MPPIRAVRPKPREIGKMLMGLRRLRGLLLGRERFLDNLELILSFGMLSHKGERMDRDNSKLELQPCKKSKLLLKHGNFA